MVHFCFATTNYSHMLFSKEYVAYLAREVTKKLIAGEVIETKEVPAVTEKSIRPFSKNSRLKIASMMKSASFLRPIPTRCRKAAPTTEEMFRKGEERAGTEIQGGPMRLSRDKVNKLAHVVTDALADLDQVDFIEDRSTVRLEVRKVP